MWSGLAGGTPGGVPPGGVPLSDVWYVAPSSQSYEQNPVHTFNRAGLYTISLVSGNSYGNSTLVSKINYINVTQPDLYLTISVVDSAFAPIPTAVMTDVINGGNYTANWNGVILYPFHEPQTITGVISAPGYTSQTFSYYYDTDANLIVQLYTQAENPVQSTWYTPKQIAITVVSYSPAGVKIPNANINLRAIGSSLQADSQLQTMYGMNPDVANQMVNGTLIMSTNTGMDGSATFTVLSSIRYKANVTDPSTGRVWGAILHPGLDPYTIWLGDKPNTVNTTEVDQLNQTRLWAFKPDNGNWTMAMQYRDRTGKTSNVRFIVKSAGNLTEVYNTSLGNPGTNLVYANKTYRNIIGDAYYYYWVATRV
jgi:PKD repeat protein